jgi:hypothetical protein
MRYPALAACLLATSILTTSGAGAEETFVMTGVYTATEEASTGPIRAVFKSAEGQASETAKWSVLFIVTFDSAEYRFHGSAEGEMTHGNLSGWVENEPGTRRFNFAGEHEDGRFEGRHFELVDFQESPTGTLTLRREKSEAAERP